MPSLESILNSIDKTDRKLVLAKLRTFAKYSSIHGQFLTNLEQERLISKTAWQDLIRTILDSSPDPPRLRDAMVKTLRSHLFCGPPAKCSPNTIFGRASTSEDLARSFMTQHHFGSLPNALTHIRYVKRRDLSALREKWRHFLLANFVMWSTFDPGGGRPFQGIRRSARFFRALFGLPASDPDSPLLLLEYALPDGIVARMPTVVEAYAGDQWLYHFRPAGRFEIEEGYGKTYVWDELARLGEAGRPEVVHKPITGHALASDLEEVLS